MSHEIEAYIPKGSKDESGTFEAIISHLSKYHEFSYRNDTNRFTKQKILNLVFNENYVVSVFFDDVNQLHSDLNLNKEKEYSKVRILFGEDSNGEYEEVDIGIFEYLESLDDVVIYSPYQKKVVFNASHI